MSCVRMKNTALGLEAYKACDYFEGSNFLKKSNYTLR